MLNDVSTWQVDTCHKWQAALGIFANQIGLLVTYSSSFSSRYCLHRCRLKFVYIGKSCSGWGGGVQAWLWCVITRTVSAVEIIAGCCPHLLPASHNLAFMWQKLHGGHTSVLEYTFTLQSPALGKFLPLSEIIFIFLVLIWSFCWWFQAQISFFILLSQLFPLPLQNRQWFHWNRSKL